MTLLAVLMAKETVFVTLSVWLRWLKSCFCQLIRIQNQSVRICTRLLSVPRRHSHIKWYGTRCHESRSFSHFCQQLVELEKKTAIKTRCCCYRRCERLYYSVRLIALCWYAALYLRLTGKCHGSTWAEPLPIFKPLTKVSFQIRLQCYYNSIQA